MIRHAQAADAEILARLALELWPEHTLPELTAEFTQLLQSESSKCFLKYIEGIPVGFAQCQLRRDYVEGTSTSPVGYLEGIFVCQAFRHRGIARELLAVCETWARDRGCTEFASDCELTNTESLRFHQAMGFLEANRIICFTRKLI